MGRNGNPFVERLKEIGRISFFKQINIYGKEKTKFVQVALTKRKGRRGTSETPSSFRVRRVVQCTTQAVFISNQLQPNSLNKTELGNIPRLTLVQLVLLDPAGPVFIVALEDGLPLLNEREQLGELVKVDRAARVFVKDICKN